MIWPAFEDVILPLVDHLVGERADEFVASERRAGEQRRQQGQRETDFPFRSFRHRPATPGGAGAGPAHKHADGGREPSAPDERDRRKDALKVSTIEIAPDVGQL